MEVIDAQVHLAPEALSSHLIEAMDSAGVAAALIVNQAKYGPDNTRQLEAATQHPERFAVVGGIDPRLRDIDEEVRRLKAQPGIVGIRTVIPTLNQMSAAAIPASTVQRITKDVELWESGGYSNLFAAAQLHRLPVCVYLPGRLADVPPICQAYPDLQLVIDHLNLSHHPLAINREDEPFAELKELIPLARFPNVAVKASGMPAVSRAPYPFLDLWPHLQGVLSAFGPERIMWGSDWTQLLERASYVEGIDYIRTTSELGPADIEAVMGSSLRRIFGWPGHADHS